MAHEDALALMESRIRTIPDYPKQGIMFRDITPMLQDAEAFGKCIEELRERVRDMKIDYIAGIDARGFIIGSALAYSMGIGFIPARKKGKLPYKSISIDYALEYGTATLEMHEDSFEKGSHILIVDDLLATGGTAGAVGSLVERLGGVIEGYLFVVELPDLRGRERLGAHKIISLIKFLGD